MNPELEALTQSQKRMYLQLDFADKIGIKTPDLIKLTEWYSTIDREQAAQIIAKSDKTPEEKMFLTLGIGIAMGVLIAEPEKNIISEKDVET